MASTYSDRYKLELQETGANANTWGENTNNNLEVVDAFTAGYLSKDVAGSANVTLTTNNADPTAESSNKVIEFTGALTGDITVFVPAVESNYIFFNNTSGSQSLTVAPTGHGSNGVAVVQGAHTIMYNKGDAMVDLFANSLGTFSVKNSLTVNGTVFTSANGTINATSYSGNGSTLTGVSSIPAGTTALFFQGSAPSGWTQNTDASINTTTMRVVTGTGGAVGGTDAFGTTFAGSRTTETGDILFNDLSSASGSGNFTMGAATVSNPQLPSHTHSSPIGPNNYFNPAAVGCQNVTNGSTGTTGGGGSHTHPLSGSVALSGNASATTALSVPNMDVKFANVIACSKD